MLTVWRPSLPESIDGNPIATTVPELFHEFRYERLPDSEIAPFMRPEVVLGAILFYLISKRLLKGLSYAIAFNPKSEAFLNFIAIHNLSLAVFSGVVAYNSWPVVINHLMQRGFMATYCDADGTLWGAGGLGAWSTIFYISKFYEFLDTWILVLKGKQASFLQVYHHSGIVLFMWVGVVSQSSWLLFVVLLNSVIHTFMYTYFFVKSISPKTEIKAARYLTMAQIGQFIVGIVCSAGLHFLGDDCITASSRFGLTFIHSYAFGLIALFTAFSNRKYKKV